MRKRTDLIRIVLALCFLMIILRVYFLQVIEHQKYVDLAGGNLYDGWHTDNTCGDE